MFIKTNKFCELDELFLVLSMGVLIKRIFVCLTTFKRVAQFRHDGLRFLAFHVQ